MDTATVKNSSYNEEYILGMLRSEARAEATRTLEAVYLKQSAAALADELSGGMLKEAEAAVAPLADRVRTAEEALRAAQEAHARRMASFWSKFKPGDSRPETRDPAIEAAQAELDNATHNASQPSDRLRLLRTLIDALRNCPGPDPQSFAILQDALKGGVK